MHLRTQLPTLLLATLAGAGGCDTLTGSDFRGGRLEGVWALRPFQSHATAMVHGGNLHVSAVLPHGGPGGLRTEVSVSGGTYTGAGEYALEPGRASVAYMLSYDEVGARYEGEGGMLVIDEAADGTISGGIWFNTRSTGETPVGSRARFYARFQSVPLEYRP